MALATRCPHCHTSFRVAHDQLKLRAGLVRCGACKEIFNGVENLLPASAPQQASIPQDSVPNPAPAVADAQHEHFVPDPSQQPAVTPEHSASLVPEKHTREEHPPTSTPTDHPNAVAAAGTDINADPLQRMTLMDFSAWKEDDETAPALRGHAAETEPSQVDDAGSYSQTELLPEAPDELDQAIEDLQRKPWRRKSTKSGIDDDIEGDDDATEPDFVRRARRQQQIGRTLHALTSVGSTVLLVALLAQSVYAFRNQIAAWLPQTTPMLVEVCARIGCDVGLPAQIDTVSIESSELQTLVPNQNTFVLNALLRNRSSISQAWPSIELTLNDANEKPIARRVFSPREYLMTSASDSKKGLDANAEQQVRVFFELSDLKASGYRVYLFYP